MATRVAEVDIHAAARFERLAAKGVLRRRRAQILAETAAQLLSGADPDRDVLPGL